MLIDLSCPVENQGTIVKTNSETNEPYLLLKLFNLSDKTITGITFRVLAYDANGTELGKLPVTLEELSAAPKAYFAENKAVSLVGVEDAKHFVVQVEAATFEDGSTYTLSEENVVETDETSASIDDALLLRQFSKNAICFSKEHDNYWRCICGRPNQPECDTCVRCGLNKEEALENFSSPEALANALEKAKEKEAEEILAEEMRLAEEKAAKKAKTKKTVLIALIAVAVAVVVAIAGFFVYKAVLNISANNALKNGDYYKAYELYEKSGSKKITETIQHVQGNTPANLLFQSGLMAEDEGNLYYLSFDNATYAFHLIRENKTTKETKTLTDAAGGSLNVTSDWIYFCDTENGYVKRISKDGQTIETIVEKSAHYMSVIGNTIYYIQRDFDNPNHLSEEQCETLAAQGQMKVFTRLYKMNVEDRKPKLVMDESIHTCYIYGDRIYYLTDTEDEWAAYNLYSTDLNGKDKQAVIEAPVASFLLQGDDLYYIQMYNEAMRGQEITADSLTYTIIKHNLKTGEKQQLATDYMATYLNANNDKLFFIALDRAAYMNSLTNPEEQTPMMALYTMDLATETVSPLVTGEVSIFNVVGDDVILYVGSQGMCRVKADGTGFEEVNVVSSIETEIEEPQPETAQ